ncbi:hypothetical protein Pcinc_007759 [Petrolisthes cinctipes]|uniref:Uncharacterized protein n=1 Tax=Petrolisthes cinctipes TaxID=88211 RepID=A0AAE1GA91_PETCI|nr:hypothetical protein Pcinc_007759 [Petrolisthes cinctipes]
MEDLEQSNKSRFEVNVLSLRWRNSSPSHRPTFSNSTDLWMVMNRSEHLHVSGHTPTVLAKLHDEWQRLDNLKRENLSRLINQQRPQLEAMWEKCYVGEDDIQAFQPYF